MEAHPDLSRCSRRGLQATVLAKHHPDCQKDGLRNGMGAHANTTSCSAPPDILNGIFLQNQLYQYRHQNPLRKAKHRLRNHQVMKTMKEQTEVLSVTLLEDFLVEESSTSNRVVWSVSLLDHYSRAVVTAIVMEVRVTRTTP